MKIASVVLALSVAASTTASAKPVASRIAVSPGTSIGPIHIGMARAKIAALGLPTGPNYPTEPPTMTSVGPYTVDYDAEGKVREVAIQLRKATHGLVIGKKTIARDATIT